MTTLAVHLSQVQIEVLDEIMSGRRDYHFDDRSRGHAIGEIVLKHHQLLGERDDRKAEADAAQQALRKNLDAVSRELDGVRRALDAERASRRRDLGDLKGRLARALRAAGFTMPGSPDG